MDSIALLRSLYTSAHGTLEATLAEVTPELAHWNPPGKALPIAAQYAHTVVCEDIVVSVFIRKTAPLLSTTWAGKTGLSELPPESNAWEAWARRVRIDLPAFREYAAAVYGATDAYLASLSPADVAAELEFFGQKRTLGDVLGLQAAHVATHTGEISCLKGLQGAKGYPW